MSNTNTTNSTPQSTKNEKNPSLKSVHNGLQAESVLDKNIIELSETEFAYDICKFSLKASKIEFTGMYQEGILKRLDKLGISKRRSLASRDFQFILERNNVISEITNDEIKAILKSELDGSANFLEFFYRGLKVKLNKDRIIESYVEFAPNRINDRFLALLKKHEKLLLRDTANESYFLFKNGIVMVTADDIVFSSYASLKNSCVWQTHIKNRNFEISKDYETAEFYKFVKNVCNAEDRRISAFMTGMGYLMNSIGSPSKPKAVILYDEQITDASKPMGGTGKGILAQSLSEVRQVVKIDGKRFDSNDRFRYQDIDQTTQILWLDDIKAEVGFETFHSVLTDGWNIEKKHRDSFHIPASESPKLLMTSNIILSSGGTTNLRRQFILELSDFYTKKIKTGLEEPIVDEHGGLMFSDSSWSSDEWSKFYTFMLKCCQLYLKEGLIDYPHKNVSLNTLIQGTSRDFVEWVNKQNFITGKKYVTIDYYNDLLESTQNTPETLTMQKNAKYLNKYAEFKGWNIVRRRSNGIASFIFNN